MEVNRVEAYSLLEFMLLVEKEILNGYRVCTSNENYPQNFGSFYSCGLVKEAVGAKEEPRVVKQEELEKLEEVKKPIGRPKKVG